MVNCVEPPKKRTSFLESITTSAVEEANMKSRKRQSSDTESEYNKMLWIVLWNGILITATKVKKSRSSSKSAGKTADKKVNSAAPFST